LTFRQHLNIVLKFRRDRFKNGGDMAMGAKNRKTHTF